MPYDTARKKTNGGKLKNAEGGKRKRGENSLRSPDTPSRSETGGEAGGFKQPKSLQEKRCRGALGSLWKNNRCEEEVGKKQKVTRKKELGSVG